MHQRFIPACAGNTSASAASDPALAVHPRVCGEYGFTPDNEALFGGSSPRVRGTQGAACGNQSGDRFIPACAGNTNRSTTAARRCAVHPRVCGEHAWKGG